MRTEALQRKLDQYAEKASGLFASIADGSHIVGATLPGGIVGTRLRGLGTGLADIEAVRESLGGFFGHRTGQRWFDSNAATRSRGRDGEFRRGSWVWEPTSEWAFDHNIVTNEGLAYIIDVAFREVADIAPWYCVGYTNAGTYTPAAGDTYATPNHDEFDGADIDETVRQAWVDGSPSGTTTRSVAGTAVTYTGDQSFTAQGAAMKGGGSAPTSLQNTAGGGTLLCASDFSSTVAMTLDATLDITYTLQASDDGA